MRFEFDNEKSRSVKKKHGVSLKEAQDIFDQAYIVDQKNDNPEQFRAIGWSRGRLCSVIFEIRHDARAYTITSSRFGRQREKKSKAMPKTSRKNPTTTKTPTADDIAEMASSGEDI